MNRLQLYYRIKNASIVNTMSHVLSASDALLIFILNFDAKTTMFIDAAERLNREITDEAAGRVRHLAINPRHRVDINNI